MRNSALALLVKHQIIGMLKIL